jgi:AraC family transcriptional regulator
MRASFATSGGKPSCNTLKALLYTSCDFQGRRRREDKMTDLFVTGKVPLGADLLPRVFTHLVGSSDQWNWEGMLARNWQLEPPEDPFLVHHEYDLVIFHGQGMVDLQWQMNGRTEHGRSYGGEVFLEPKEESRTYYWTGTPMTNLHLYLFPSFVERVIADLSRGDPTRVAFVPRFNVRDPFLEHLGFLLMAELASGGAQGNLYAESLANTLVLHLLRTSSTLPVIHTLPERAFTQGQVSKVRDYINDRLAQHITLTELADVVALSSTHFSRLFKQSTGVAPYQYVIQCRVERAKILLRKGDMTLAEVTRAVGFADQSHLARHFKRIMGVSPNVVLRDGKNVQDKHDADLACYPYRSLQALLQGEALNRPSLYAYHEE